MWLGSTAQHAVKAVLYIAEHGGDGPVRVDDIASALGAPRNYLSKTLHHLVRAGVLRSTRGPNGGFRLVDSPATLTVDRIIAPFIPVTESRCLLGRATCGGANPCAAHHRWQHLAGAVDAFFAGTSAAQLLADAQAPRTARAAAGRSKRAPAVKRPARKNVSTRSTRPNPQS